MKSELKSTYDRVTLCWNCYWMVCLVRIHHGPYVISDVTDCDQDRMRLCNTNSLYTKNDSRTDATWLTRGTFLFIDSSHRKKVRDHNSLFWNLRAQSNMKLIFVFLWNTQKFIHILTPNKFFQIPISYFWEKFCDEIDIVKCLKNEN